MAEIVASFKKNRIGILLILAASLDRFWTVLLEYSGGQINGSLITGFFLYFIGALLMIIAFRFEVYLSAPVTKYGICLCTADRDDLSRRVPI